MNFKRRKSKRSIRCSICTPHRWKGNGKDRFKAKDAQKQKEARKEVNAVC